MKLKVEQHDLMSGISIVSKAVSRRATLPILECILLTAHDNGLELAGNNLELGIRTSVIDAGVELAGAVALDAHLFSEIIQKLPDGTVEISTDKKNATTIKSGKIVFKIMGAPASEFPALPEITRDNKFSIKQAILRDMIRQTIFSVAADASKPIFTGELIKVENGTLEIVSVDGFRISYRHNSIDVSEQSFNVIVPGKTLGEVVKLLSGDDGDASIYFTDRHILFELNTCTIVSQLISGDFIAFKNTLEAEHNTLVKINRVEFIMSLERACLVAVESGKKTPVVLQIENDIITITSNTERGTVQDEISAEIEGSTLSIAFNPRYLIDALKAIEDRDVAVQFGSELTGCIIRPIESGNYKYFVLPLRLKN